MRRVLQDSWNEGHPWFEIEQDKFTCARGWVAALERREGQPHGLYVDKSHDELMRMFGEMVNVAEQYPEVPHDVLW